MLRSSVAHLRIEGKELQHLADIVQRHLRQVGFRGRAGAGMFDGIGMGLDRYVYIYVCVKVCALGQTKLDVPVVQAQTFVQDLPKSLEFQLIVIHFITQ